MKTLIGIIKKKSMLKTSTVIVKKLVKHPLYKKFIKKTTKIHIHDEKNSCNEGDIVKIKKCKPISKTKSWILVKILQNKN